MRGRRICAGIVGFCCCFAAAASAKNMTLTIWDWHQPRVDVLKPKLAEYTKLHPNIRFQLTLMDNYWDKLLATMVAGTPPDIVQFHNSEASSFVPKLMAPFPPDLFPLNTMRNEYYSFDQAFTFDGRMYFFPVGVMTGAIYYNKQQWSESGLGNLPTSWDELRLAARKLSKVNAAGKLTQAGFNFSPSQESAQYLWDDFNYQQGGWLFNKEKTGVAINTPQGLKALNTLASMALQDHVSPVPGDTAGGLETGKSAMQYNWTWYQGILKKVKNLQFGAFALPTEDGAVNWARGRNNWEVGHGVPAGISHERQIEAFKFLKWLYTDDKFYTTLNDALGCVPGRIDLWNKPEIKDDPVISVVAKQVPYSIFPGERPNWLDTVLGTMTRDVLSKKRSPEDALKRAQDEGDLQFKKHPTKWIVERQYKPGK